MKPSNILWSTNVKAGSLILGPSQFSKQKIKHKKGN